MQTCDSDAVSSCFLHYSSRDSYLQMFLHIHEQVYSIFLPTRGRIMRNCNNSFIIDNKNYYWFSIVVIVLVKYELLFHNVLVWDNYNYCDYRGVLISEVNLYYKTHFRTFVIIFNTGVSSFLECPQ